MIICVSPPPLFNQQSSPRDRRIADESESVDNMPAERGRVFINEEPPPDIRINNITVTTRGNIGKLSCCTAIRLTCLGMFGQTSLR